MQKKKIQQEPETCLGPHSSSSKKKNSYMGLEMHLEPLSTSLGAKVSVVVTYTYSISK